jgi:3-methyladenine DNA glycosylase Tag
MQSFAEIYALACARHGGPEQFEAELPKSTPLEQLRAIPDHRWLAGFTRVIFQAGISWKVIDAKWQGFEDAFHQFDLGRNAMLSDEDLERLERFRFILAHSRRL